MMEVGITGLDWLTLTSFNPLAMARFLDFVDSVGTRRDSKRMQYVGHSSAERRGTAFYGEAMQRGRVHALLQVSGMLAQSAWHMLHVPATMEQFKVTRIDVQLTIPYERSDWSQAALFDLLRLNYPERSVSYVESQSGPDGSKLATVYVGARSSERLWRIYEKVGQGDEVWLRFEVEYKNGLATAVARSLAEGVPMDAIFRNEIERLARVDCIAGMIEPYLSETPPAAPKVVRTSGNTERWLRTQVVPALDRFLNDHGSDGESIAALFRSTLDDHQRRLDES